MLAGCGGGGGSAGGSAAQTGQFFDDPVSGLTYVCTGGSQTYQGTTGPLGEFTFETEQACTFSVGKVSLGTLKNIPSDGKVTPYDVAGVSRTATSAPSAVAIAQFLQTLNDGSASGKIVIPTATTAAFNSTSVAAVTLAASTGSISQFDLNNLVTTVLPTKTLVSASAAAANLTTQMTQNNISTTGGSVSASAPVVLNSISVTASNDNRPAGLTAQLTANGYYSDGTTKDLSSSVSWNSSDTSTVTVANAVATGKKAGNATVTASLTPSGSSTAITGSTVITTAAPVVVSVAITNSNSLPAGLTDQLTATATLTDGSTSNVTTSVTWASSDTTKATIDATTGLVTGIAKGSTTITASYGTFTPITATYAESVLDPSILNLIISYVQSGLTSIQNSATATLNAIANFTDKTTSNVTAAVSWIVNPANIASVATNLASNLATLTGSNVGSATITANYKDSNNNTVAGNILNISITAAPPTVQDVTLSLNVLGVAPSTVTGNISATDKQGYALTYSIGSQASVGKATIDSATGAYTYTVNGHTTETTDSFTVSASNGVNSSSAKVNMNLYTDPLLSNQWHIQNVGYSAFASVLPTSGNDMNVAGAWAAGYTGKGIKVAIVDTGLEIAHEDLSANVDKENSRNLVNSTNDPSPSTTGFDHGTSVAGIIGSVAFNGKGGRGVAYNATLRGYNLIAKSYTLADLANVYGGASYSSDNDIFNQSFGDANSNLPTTSTTFDAINQSSTSMRGGKGAILIKSAGNEFYVLKGSSLISSCTYAIKYGVSCDNPANDGRGSSPAHIVVGATNANGIKSSYSTAGSSIWTSAPGGEFGKNSIYATTATGNSLMPAIITTSLTGCKNSISSSKVNALDSLGDNENATSCQYTASMNGTSSAAPNLAGVVALMLEANSKLSYRDVKHILAKTAKKVDPNNSGVTRTDIITNTNVVLDQGWFKNAADFWFSNWYGFGGVDAEAAVLMAKNYTDYLADVQSISSALKYGSNQTLPFSTTGKTFTFKMAPTFTKVEQVTVKVNIGSSLALTCNQIELTSPSGTKSILMNAGSGFHSGGYYQTSLVNVKFLSNAFYDENSSGDWILRFLDFCGSTYTTIYTTDTQTLQIYGR